MDERIVQFRVGVMVLATIIILAILLLLFGDLPSLVKGTRTIYIEFPQAPGVTPDTPVRVNGVLIGRIKEVELNDQVGVLLTAKIEEKYELRKNQMARIGGSLLGDAVVEIIPGDGRGSPDFLKDGDHMQGVVAKDPLQAIVNLEANVSEAVKSIAMTSDEIRSLVIRANKIIETNEPSINRVIENAELTVAQLKTTVANIDQIVGDPMVRESLKKTVNGLPLVLDDLQTAIGGVKNTMQTADRNLLNLEGITKPLGERGPRLVENVDRAVAQLDGVMKELTSFTQSLSNSQGTISRLVKDPTLYIQVAETVSNLNELTRGLKPIVNDVRAFSDKAARHPEQFGLRGLIQSNSGIK
jgi:phospholipid/cholesterol/gamma-HCH transport system substrate-binding protein